jgi:MYXO-CTERM domain-containing protein
VLGFVLMASRVAVAAVTEVGPGDDVEAAINGLNPGDELVLKDGDYTLTDAWHIAIAGTAASPIVIRAEEGATPHLHRPGVDQNIVDFDDVSYVEIRGIRFSGGSAGLRFITANHVTVSDCEIFDTDDVAISANSGSDYDHLRIIHNHIHDTGGTGEGMYIGCNDNGCRVHDSLFAGNYIHHTNGPNVSQGDGIEIKEGSYANVVRDNVIHDTGYPCIITYSTVGNGAPNVIERNLMWNCGDHGIQSAADVIIRNNIILGAAANGIANQPHQAGTPSNIQILFNTILAPENDAIASTGITGTVLIANNAVYAASGDAIRVSGNLGQVVVAGNVGEGGLDGAPTGFLPGDLASDFVSANYSGSLPNDVFPKAGSALIAAGDDEHTVTDDFNGTPRNGATDVGAYLYAAINPGGSLDDGFKGEAPSDDGSDAGSGAGGEGTVGDGGTANAGGSTDGGVEQGGNGNSHSNGGNGGVLNSGGTSGGAAGATPALSAGASSESGVASSTDDSEDLGCSCRLAEASAPSNWLLFAFGVGFSWRGRSRRR